MKKDEKLKQDRIRNIFDAITRVTEGDYSVQIESSDKNDDIDALIAGFNLMIGDIRETHAALKKSEERLRSTLSSMDDLVFVLDKSGIFLDYYQPPSKSDLYVPPEQFLGKSFKELLPPYIVELIEAAVAAVEKTGRVQQFEYSLEMKGKIEWYSAKISMRKDSIGEFDGVTAVIRDITGEKTLQERLVRQEKMAVLGELAGGVGHELRNPLGVIKNAAYFLNMTMEDPDAEMKEILEILDKEVCAAEKIIGCLLEFARPNPPIQRRTNINQILKKALSRINVPENIEILHPFVESLPSIPADPDQIVRVFENIFLNAVQAMPEGGRLTIETAALNTDWVTVSIGDTGIGIPGDNLGKVFEPLFTTKAKGIGLGMAIAKTFVEGHGGGIDINSEPGRGSTFIVKLPIQGSKKEEK